MSTPIYSFPSKLPPATLAPNVAPRAAPTAVSHRPPSELHRPVDQDPRTLPGSRPCSSTICTSPTLLLRPPHGTEYALGSSNCSWSSWRPHCSPFSSTQCPRSCAGWSCSRLKGGSSPACFPALCSNGENKLCIILPFPFFPLKLCYIFSFFQFLHYIFICYLP